MKLSKNIHVPQHVSLSWTSPHSRGNRALRTLLPRNAVLEAVTHLPLASHFSLHINPNFFDVQTQTLWTPYRGELQHIWNFWPPKWKRLLQKWSSISQKGKPSKQTLPLKSLENINNVEKAACKVRIAAREEQQRCYSVCLSRQTLTDEIWT